MKNSSCKTDKRRVTSVNEELEKAVQTENPLLLSFKADFATVLERVQSWDNFPQIGRAHV